MLRSVGIRLYNDYIKPCRASEYAEMLEAAKQLGYTMISIADFWRMRKSNCFDKEADNRILILRHDVDTAPKATSVFSDAEKAVGAKASYYFRLSTIDIPLMQALAEQGHEVGYHYEELATVAKKRGVNKREQVPDIIQEARELFLENLSELRERTNLPLRSISSHGDFVNRSLNVSNTMLLKAEWLRGRAGIDFEAYDPEIEDGLAFRASDVRYPRNWRPRDPSTAIREGLGPILLLTHPGHWGGQPLSHAHQDLTRLCEGFLFKFGVPHVWGRRRPKLRAA